MVWSSAAKSDLKHLQNRIFEKSKSKRTSQNYSARIIKCSQAIVFAEQFQVDEFLGAPFRRIVFEHFKLVYIVQSPTEIRILQLFDTYQSPKKLRKI